MRRLLEPLPAFGRQAVIRAATNLLRPQPTIFHEAKYRRAHKTLADTKISHHPYEATKPYGTTTGCNCIAKNGRYQRTRAQRWPRTKFINEFLTCNIDAHLDQL